MSNLTLVVLIILQWWSETIAKDRNGIDEYVNKCCGIHEFMSQETSKVPKCYKSPLNQFQLKNLSDSLDNSSNLSSDQDMTYELFNIEDDQFNSTLQIKGIPNCTELTVLKNTRDTWFRVQGHNVELGLRWPFDPLWLRLPSSSYCLNEDIYDNNDTHSLNSNYTDRFENFVLIVCKSSLVDYHTYIVSRYSVGISDIFSSVAFLSVAIIYIILWKSHNVVGWLICCLCCVSVLYFFLSGLLTILDASWLEVETTKNCLIWYSTARYLQVVLTASNFVTHWHMFLTFWKMTFRVKQMTRSLYKLKIYLPIIWLGPLVLITIDQIFARQYPLSSWVQESGKFAHGRCSPPETLIFDQILAVMILLTLISVLLSGFIIGHLRFSSKFNNPSFKTKFVKSSTLFLKLLLGSGSPILIRFLAFLYFGKEDPLKWYFTLTFCATEVFSAVYYFFIFGVTRDNLNKIKLILQGKPLVLSSDSNRSGHTKISSHTQSTC